MSVCMRAGWVKQQSFSLYVSDASPQQADEDLAGTNNISDDSKSEDNVGVISSGVTSVRDGVINEKDDCDTEMTVACSSCFSDADSSCAGIKWSVVVNGTHFIGNARSECGPTLNQEENLMLQQNLKRRPLRREIGGC